MIPGNFEREPKERSSGRPPGSGAPFKEGLPRAIQAGPDARQGRKGREVFPRLDALPIPRAQTGFFRRLFLRDASRKPPRRDVFPEMSAEGTGYRLLRWHDRHRRGNQKIKTRGFTSCSDRCRKPEMRLSAR